MKTLFFGTPAIAVPYLDLLRQKTQVLAVITNPDEPAGRGYAVKSSPVKEAALRLGLSVLQPESLKQPSPCTLSLQGEGGGEGRPDLGVVVAYGKILPKWILDIPRLGFINVHFSLLPAYRGAAPIQRALMAGETQTGVSLFWLDEGMDTGNLFLQKTLSIAEGVDADALRALLVPLGIEALADVLDRVEKDHVIRQAQSGKVSLAPPLKKEEGRIDWSQPSRQIYNLIRGVTPWPGATTRIPSPSPLPKGEGGQRPGEGALLKILKASPVLSWEGQSASPAGTVVGLVRDEGFVVKCGQEFLKVLQVQPEGKRPMSAWAFWQGARLQVGAILNSR